MISPGAKIPEQDQGLNELGGGTQTTPLGSKRVKDLQSEDTKLTGAAPDLKLEGELYQISEWDEWTSSTGDPTPLPGYFFAIELDDAYKSKTKTVYNADGTPKETTDNAFIIRIDNFITKSQKVKIECESKVIAEIDVSSVKHDSPKPIALKVKNSVKINK